MSEGQTATTTSTGTEGNSGQVSGRTDSGLRGEKSGGDGQNLRSHADVNAPQMDGFRDPAELREKAGNNPRTAKDGGTTQSLEGETRKPTDGQSTPSDDGKIRLKVYGQEREFDINDPTDRREILRQAQMGMGAQKQMSEAAEIKKQATLLWETLQKDPRKALQAGKHDPVKLAEQIIADKLRQEMMDPNERRAHEAERDRDQYRQQIESQRAQEKAAYEGALRDQRAKKWEGEILEAITTTNGLPKEPAMVREIAKTILDAKSNGIDLDAKQAAQYVLDQSIVRHTSMFSNMSVENIIRHFGKDFVDKIRNHSIEEMKKPLNPAFAKPPAGTMPQKPQERRFKDWNTMREEWDRKTRG